MEQDEFTIMRKFNDDGIAYYNVVFGWKEGRNAGTHTRAFRTRMQAIGFINDELQKEPAVVIDGIQYPSHVVKLFNARTLELVPAVRLYGNPDQKVGVRWVSYGYEALTDGKIIYYHKKHWEEV